MAWMWAGFYPELELSQPREKLAWPEVIVLIKFMRGNKSSNSTFTEGETGYKIKEKERKRGVEPEYEILAKEIGLVAEPSSCGASNRKNIFLKKNDGSLILLFTDLPRLYLYSLKNLNEEGKIWVKNLIKDCEKDPSKGQLFILLMSRIHDAKLRDIYGVSLINELLKEKEEEEKPEYQFQAERIGLEAASSSNGKKHEVDLLLKKEDGSSITLFKNIPERYLRNLKKLNLEGIDYVKDLIKKYEVDHSEKTFILLLPKIVLVSCRNDSLGKYGIEKLLEEKEKEKPEYQFQAERIGLRVAPASDVGQLKVDLLDESSIILFKNIPESYLRNLKKLNLEGVDYVKDLIKKYEADSSENTFILLLPKILNVRCSDDNLGKEGIEKLLEKKQIISRKTSAHSIGSDEVVIAASGRKKLKKPEVSTLDDCEKPTDDYDDAAFFEAKKIYEEMGYKVSNTSSDEGYNLEYLEDGVVLQSYSLTRDKFLEIRLLKDLLLAEGNRLDRTTFAHHMDSCATDSYNDFDADDFALAEYELDLVPDPKPDPKTKKRSSPSSDIFGPKASILPQKRGHF